MRDGSLLQPPAPGVASRRRFLVIASAATATACGGTMSPSPGPDGAVTDAGTDAGATDTPAGDTPAGDTAMGDTATGDGASDASCNPAGDDFGAVADFTVGHYTLVRSIQVIIGRDAGGLYAYSASCTHTGCTVPAPTSVTDVSVCPCHNSRFDSNGTVQPGSVALRNLQHYALAVCNGRIFVDRFTNVAATLRVAVP